jgi:chorismate mutase
VIQAVVRQMRDAVVDTDVSIVAALNRRIELIARLRRYGSSHGVETADPAGEEWGLRYLQAANPGPLSAARLEAIFAAIMTPIEDAGGRNGST